MPRKASGSVSTATIQLILLANHSNTKQKKLKKFVLIQIQKKIDELKSLVSDQSEELSID
jgi:hypothetical protein